MSVNVRALALGGLKAADSLVGPVVGRLPASVKFGREYIEKRLELEKYEDNQQAAIDAQSRGLANALEAARRTPYWSKMIPANLSDARGALGDLPILDRETLSRRYPEMTSIPMSKLDLMSTSGSGGEPVNFLLSRSRRSVEWAYVTHAWRRANYAHGAWRVVFRGYPPKNALGVGVQQALREVRVTAMRTSEETYNAVAQQMEEKNIRFVQGYPSAISVFASWLIANKPLLARTVTGVFPVSEKLEPERFASIQSGFPGAKVVGFYGLSEKSAFAVCEDPALSVYSFAPTYGFVEIVDHSGKLVDPGQVGRVVTTRLEYPGSSLVRYDTGDVARLINNQNAATGECLRVSEISPRRSVSYVVSKDGEEIATSPGIQAGSQLFQGNIAEYQIVQQRPGSVQFLYRTLMPLSADFNEALKKEIQGKLGDGFIVSASEVDEIPHGANGKKPLVVRKFHAS